MTAPTRILIADDHPLTRSGLAEWIKRNPRYELVAEVENGRDAWEALERLKPDVALLDIQMPELDGIAVVRKMKEQGLPTRAIMLTSFSAQPYVMASLLAGAAGFVLKTTAIREVEVAVAQVMQGRLYLDSQLGDILKDRELAPEPLTAREREVLLLASRGFSIRDTASRLSITERTVQAHLTSIYSKFNCRSKSEALLVALKFGLLSLEELLEDTSLEAHFR
ncbi:MAG: response regulator transcription factor [Synergistaceae bacterium]|nr:response regulator transcription factor [Synergistaceae bacterium]